ARDEGVVVRFGADVGGVTQVIDTVSTDFSYDAFGVVLGAVVGDDDLQIRVVLRQRRLEGAAERLVRAVVGGDADGDEGPVARRAPEPARAARRGATAHAHLVPRRRLPANRPSHRPSWPARRPNGGEGARARLPRWAWVGRLSSRRRSIPRWPVRRW